MIFSVAPYHRNIARALLKAPKCYFYDNALVLGDDGRKLENLVACALLKETHFRQDVAGEELDLRYIRDKDGHELDFLILRDRQPWQLLEVKWSDADPSPDFRRFLADQALRRLQVVGELTHSKSYPDGLRIEPAREFLSRLDLSAA